MIIFSLAKGVGHLASLLLLLLKMVFNYIKVHTGKFVYNSRTFQCLLKGFPTVFKD